jgi:hypothetical protein
MAKKTADTKEVVEEKVIEEPKKESKPKTVMKMIGGRMREVKVE